MRKWVGILYLSLGLLVGCGSGGKTGSGGAQGSSTFARTDSTSQAASTVVNVTVPLQAGWNGVGFRSQQVVLTDAPAAISGLAFLEGPGYQTRNFNAVEINSGAGGRRGFWVFATQATSFTYSGQDTGPNFVDLAPGYNLVSFATDRDIPGSSVTASQNGQTVPLNSVVLTSFIEIQPPRTYANVDVTTGTLRPGLAYWVFASQAVRLNLPANPTPSPGASPGPSSSPTASPIGQVTSITVTPTNSTTTKGQTVQFTATGTLPNGSSANVTNQATWSSDAPSIAASLGTGQFKALNAGTCNITATFGGSSGSTRLTVTDFGIPATPSPSSLETLNVDFEPPTYVVGSVVGQDGWEANPFAADQSVVLNTFGFASYALQSFRISNAVTSTVVGQLFSRQLVNGVGETSATAGGFPVGSRRNHFEVEFDVATTVAILQPGLVISLAPERGDGNSRMSFLRLTDTAPGVLVEFADVQGTTNPATFVTTPIGTISRGTPHRLKLTMDTLEGPSNDVVKVFIDGVQVHTGTSWENYFRFDAGAAPENTPHIVTRLLFRASGTAAPGTVGQGFVFDNLTLRSSNI